MGTKFVLSVLFGASVCANPPLSTHLVDTRGELEKSRCRQIGIKFVLDVLFGASVVQIYLYQQ